MPKTGFEYNPKVDRGFFGIGIFNPKFYINMGTLMREAYIFGAAYTFTIGERYKHQRGDTTKCPLHIPCMNYKDPADFWSHLPNNVDVVGVEIDERATPLEDFTHTAREIFILGSEDMGIPKKELDRCRRVVKLPGKLCHNVSVAGSIIMYNRWRCLNKSL